MEYSFQRYLLSKQTVDDRAINKDVLRSLKSHLPGEPLRVIETGAGIGTMLRRLVRWDILRRAEYVMLDELAENMDFARKWIPDWAAEEGLRLEQNGEHAVLLFDNTRQFQVSFRTANIFNYSPGGEIPADLLIAHAFLDLLPMPAGLSKLLSLTKNLAWLTINFDGLTSLEPTVDSNLDEQIETLYHRTMDMRGTGGDSRAGRHLFRHLADAGVDLIAAGASDWVVHPTNGAYPSNEAYFLHFILHFFEQSLTGHPELDQDVLAGWLEKRHTQVERSKMIYIAHQMDFLVKHQNPHSV